MTPVLDTHAWIWWVHGDQRLGRSTLTALDALPADQRPAISAISLWEVATLVERGRLDLGVRLERWFEHAADPRTVQVVPITPAIAAAVTDLPAGFQRDPADRLIVATCRAQARPLVTRDRAILDAKVVRRWTR